MAGRFQLLDGLEPCSLERQHLGCNVGMPRIQDGVLLDEPSLGEASENGGARSPGGFVEIYSKRFL